MKHVIAATAHRGIGIPTPAWIAVLVIAVIFAIWCFTSKPWIIGSKRAASPRRGKARAKVGVK